MSLSRSIARALKLIKTTYKEVFINCDIVMHPRNSDQNATISDSKTVKI
jgi:hypothetical protein